MAGRTVQELSNLSGKVALVTGGSRGIGRAICIALAHRGATVIVNYKGREDAARETADLVEKAGGKAIVFNTITISDGISMGTEGMKYSLVSREVIADSIETVCRAQSMDGLLAVGGCDKNMPGAMIAMARLNLPSVFVYGGTIKAGHYDGKDLTIVSAFEAVGELGALTCYGTPQRPKFNTERT